MMERIRLGETDVNNLKTMMKTDGWKLVNKMIEFSIDKKNVDLINFDWRFDESGEPDKKTVVRFKDLQKEVGVLKEFLMFLNNPVIIQKQEKEEVYE